MECERIGSAKSTDFESPLNLNMELVDFVEGDNEQKVVDNFDNQEWRC